METKGLNRSQLASLMGVSRAHITKMLNAPPNLTLRTIAQIAIALDTKPHVSLFSACTALMDTLAADSRWPLVYGNGPVQASAQLAVGYQESFTTTVSRQGLPIKVAMAGSVEKTVLSRTLRTHTLQASLEGGNSESATATSTVTA